MDDFRYAQTVGRVVEVDLITGEKLRTGVHDVPQEEEGFVSLYAPSTFGDDGTTMKLAVDQIRSVTVTDIPWT